MVLQPLQAGTPAIGVDADEKGNFEIREIAAGNYSLVAQRDAT